MNLYFYRSCLGLHHLNTNLIQGAIRHLYNVETVHHNLGTLVPGKSSGTNLV
ncbi:hypothetical protein [Lactiplantibacillus plantarum]|uniref:hypothetical protein n=1 Tax=Lactiplantibacillus plantarum TaxID=1590 RepID=UPI0030F3C542